MANSGSWVNQLNLAFAGIGCFLAVHFLIRRGEPRQANRILSLLLFLLSCNIVGAYLSQSGWYYRWPHFTRVGSQLFLLFGPLLYLYTRALVLPDFRWSWRQLSHLLPLSVGVYLALPYYLLPAAEKIRIMEGFRSRPLVATGVIQLAGILLLGAYLGKIILTLRVHGVRIRQVHSSLEHRRLIWIYVWAAALLSILLVNLLPRPDHRVLSGINLIWEGFLCAVLGLLGLSQPAIYSRDEGAALATLPMDGVPAELPAANEDRRELARIRQWVTSRRPYLDNSISLASLATQLYLPAAELSRLLNRGLGANFFEFINSYRVEEARKLLSDPATRHQGILVVAFQSGFNSKSTFNDVFRKQTGLTPTQYIASLEGGNS